jgi:hypothetical protein
MRAALAAALAAGLMLVATGCGSSSAATTQLGNDAAQLVPPSALAFVTADANLDSAQWKTVTDLFGPIELPKQLDFKRDVQPAVGDELNIAVLGVDNGKPEAVAIVKSKDEAKLRSLAARFDQGNEHYTVEDIAGWSVVADSAENFQAVRSASTGSSLADTADFKQATSQLDTGALAFAYANGAAVQKLGANLRSLVGTPRWLAAHVVAGKDEVTLDARATGGARAAAYKPTLLRDVPSGAALAVSFKNVNELLARLRSEPALRAALPFVAQLKGISGEGVLYVVAGMLPPVVTLEVRPQDPAAASKSLNALANRIGNVLPLHVTREGAKVLLTNAAANPRSTGSIVDDKAFKDALSAADVPDEVTWLAYADVPRLAPLLQALAALRQQGARSKSANLDKLDKLGTVVAYGARTGSNSQLVVRITHA